MAIEDSAIGNEAFVLTEEFVQITGLDEEHLKKALELGLFRGGFRPNGELRGVFVKDLPNDEQLSDCGIVASTGWRHALARACSTQLLEDELPLSPPATQTLNSEWTMEWE